MSLLESSENHLIVAKDLAYQTNFNRKQLIYITNNFHRFGLEWHDSYLNLKPKTAEEKKNDPAFLVWENWYEKAYNSSGVRKPKKLNAKVPLYKELIEKEKNLIENLLNISLPHYLSIKRQGRLVHL